MFIGHYFFSFFREFVVTTSVEIKNCRTFSRSNVMTIHCAVRLSSDVTCRFVVHLVQPFQVSTFMLVLGTFWGTKFKIRKLLAFQKLVNVSIIKATTTYQLTLRPYQLR